jgi:hypothetical protein
MLLGLASKINTVLSRLTATRAGYLDNLDATVSSRAAASVWTSALAAKIDDNIGEGRQVKVYTASGSFVVPTGVSQLLISGCGGGGGGSGSTSGQGGGGGGAVRRMPIPVTAADTLTVAVGAGGAGGSSSAGGNGGSSGLVDSASFQLILIPGGNGAATNGFGLGGWSTYTDQTRDVAGGASGGGTVSDGGDFLWHQGGTRTVNAGGGGACMFGTGGDGSTSSGVAAETMTAAAHGYGGGGGGGQNAAGGTGRSGLLIIEWFGVQYGS